MTSVHIDQIMQHLQNLLFLKVNFNLLFLHFMAVFIIHIDGKYSYYPFSINLFCHEEFVITMAAANIFRLDKFADLGILRSSWFSCYACLVTRYTCRLIFLFSCIFHKSIFDMKHLSSHCGCSI